MAKKRSESEKTEKSDKSEEIIGDLKKLWDSTVKVTKKGLKSAGVVISDIGDASVLKIDITKLNSNLEKKYSALGKLCVAKFIDEKCKNISADDEEVKVLLQEISSLKKKIADKEKKLEKFVKAYEEKNPVAKKKNAKKESAKSADSDKKDADGKKSKDVKKKPAAEKKAPAKKTSKKSVEKDTE